MIISLDKNIQLILSLLQKNGQGYVVGGYVRDSLLKIIPKDCDFVTDIEYDRLLDIFKKYNPKEIGKRFGIIQIKLNGIHYEIAKMRQDKGIPKNRKEQLIEFTQNIYEDLKRRDFTINAIAYDGKELYYGDVDSFNDIKENNLKFIGEPKQRIEEDPLRILRFYRFLSTKNLFDRYNIRKSFKEYSYLLDQLSKERIKDEFNKIIMGENFFEVLNMMSEDGILEKIIPEWKFTIGFNQQNKHHLYTVDQHILQSMKYSNNDLIIRLALLLHDIGKPRCFTIGDNNQGHFYGHEKLSSELAKNILTTLKYDNKTIERVSKLIKYHLLYNSNIDMFYAKKLLNKFGEEDIFRFLTLVTADKKAHKPPFDFSKINELTSLLDKILKDKLPITLNDLAINGKNLITDFNILPGKQIGEILNHLLTEVLKNPNLNNKKDLYSLTELYINK